MKRSIHQYTKQILASLLLILPFYLFAQKLPGKQDVSLWAPSGIKIDGKDTEWNNLFQAYNNATSLFYTIANDNARLYLIIRAIDPTTVKKLVAGGLSFSISKTGDKKDKNIPGVTFPVFDKNQKKYIDYKNPGKASTAFPDSIITLNNKNLMAMSKFIRFNDGKGADSLLSIYNDQGAKAAALFDNTMALTMEIAIDLKLLNLTYQDTDKFLYHIECNGMKMENLNGFNTVATPGGGTKMQVVVGSVTQRDITDGIATTDFWGEYKLAKK